MRESSSFPQALFFTTPVSFIGLFHIAESFVRVLDMSEEKKNPVSKSSPIIVAHRGLRIKYPENSLLAIETAIKAGVAGVEFDVEVTADGGLAIIHQPTVKIENGKLVEAKFDLTPDWVNQSELSYLCLLYTSPSPRDS